MTKTTRRSAGRHASQTNCPSFVQGEVSNARPHTGTALPLSTTIMKKAPPKCLFFFSSIPSHPLAAFFFLFLPYTFDIQTSSQFLALSRYGKRLCKFARAHTHTSGFRRRKREEKKPSHVGILRYQPSSLHIDAGASPHVPASAIGTPAGDLKVFALCCR